MRISRKKKKIVETKAYLHNEKITFPEVLVLDAQGGNIGVMKTGEAIRLARQNELDLILINPKSNPAVAKIVKLGQFRYQQEKEERKKIAKQHFTEVKGVRLSLRIGPHDLKIRQQQAIKFLNDGDKVKIEIILRGRELQQKPLAREVVKNFVDNVNRELPIRIEQDIESIYNKVTCTIIKQ